MPRVNRDLQRRLAARRERERRRPPAERRYRFGTPEAPEAEDEQIDGATEVEETTETGPAAPSRRVAAGPPPASRSATTKPSVRPFSAYRAEYAYVAGDLRRVAIVVGSLLVVLILLNFLLPR